MPSRPASRFYSYHKLNPKLKSDIEANESNFNQILDKDNQDSQSLKIPINEYLFLNNL